MDEKRITGIARLDEAIARIAGAAVADGLCEAVLLKGSIARGDADEFSDIDLYLVVSPQNRDAVLARREKYLSAYGSPSRSAALTPSSRHTTRRASSRT